MEAMQCIIGAEWWSQFQTASQFRGNVTRKLPCEFVFNTRNTWWSGDTAFAMLHRVEELTLADGICTKCSIVVVKCFIRFNMIIVRSEARMSCGDYSMHESSSVEYNDVLGCSWTANCLWFSAVEKFQLRRCQISVMAWIIGNLINSFLRLQKGNIKVPRYRPFVRGIYRWW